MTVLTALLGIRVAVALAEEPVPPAAPPAVDPQPAGAAEIPWRKQPIDPRFESDYTAFTVPRRHFRAGLVNLDYGLLDNLSVGLAPVYLLAGVANVHGKVTAIQTRYVDASFEANWMGYDASRLVPDFQGDRLFVSAWPLTGMVSITPHRRFGFHLGAQWLTVGAEGVYGLEDLGLILGEAVGVDLSDELVAALEEQGEVFGDARATLTQVRLGTDFRFNRRDSVILLLRSYTSVKGRVDLGYTGEEISGGAMVGFDVPLQDAVKGVCTLSYQATWEHFRVRAGIPIGSSGTNPLWWLTQGTEIYWLF